MYSNLLNKSLSSLMEYSTQEIETLLEMAVKLKKYKKDGIYKKHLENKNIALIFEKPSTRTRCAFTVACNDEGGSVEYLGLSDIQLGHKESVEDTARVLGRMFDGIAFRGFSQNTYEKLVEYSKIPVWNALTDDYHPTQILADFMTIQERFGTLSVKLTYLGDGRNNMANTLMIGAAKMGMDCTICAPSSLFPSEELVQYCVEEGKKNNCTITVTDNIDEAVQGADVLYTDVWVSMGEEEKSKDRMDLLKPYQINNELLTKTKDTVIVLHCLPAVKGNEITEEVFEKYADIIFDEAENRMHTIKAVMVASLKGEVL